MAELGSVVSCRSFTFTFRQYSTVLCFFYSRTTFTFLAVFGGLMFRSSKQAYEALSRRHLPNVAEQKVHKRPANKRWNWKEIRNGFWNKYNRDHSFSHLPQQASANIGKGLLATLNSFPALTLRLCSQPTCHCSIIVMAMGQSGHDLRLNIDRANAPNWRYLT